MIEIRGLSKSYDKGRVQAVKSLDLSVRKGELFGFLGPNGAGKTTTLKVLVGLLKPDAGTVLLGGVDVRQAPLEAKALFGWCPDEPVLYERMSGARFLAFIADVYKVDAATRERRVTELAERFEMKGALGETVASYSHGMRQKLSLMGALLHDPEILILDEPIVGLDPRAAFTLKETMRDLCRRGRTVFFSTHIMEVAERLCDRVGIINHGELVAAAPLDELRRKAGGENATLERLFLSMTDDDTRTA
jgi:ABC-2 type transport system ATP-binding protein